MAMGRTSRDRSWRRSQRLRLIARRVRIIRKAWRDQRYDPPIGRFAKWNLACSCWMCNCQLHYGSTRWYRLREAAKRRGIA